MLYERRTRRFTSIATARMSLPGVDASVEALLKDMSVEGCRIEVTSAPALAIGERCRLAVQPEPVSEILEFDLLVELRWLKRDDYVSEAGFAIVESPQKKHFQRYVDYLDWRAEFSAE